MAVTTTKMHQWIFLCVICITMRMVLASNTTAEDLIPNAETGDLSSNLTSTDIGNNTLSMFMGKHELLLSCPIYSAEAEEYELFDNGTIYLKKFNLTLNNSLYVLTNDIANFCVSFLQKNVSNEHGHTKSVHKTSYLMIFSQIGFGISMVSLLVHLIIFVIVPDLKNLPGFNLAALCASLFCSYLFLFVIGTFEIRPYQNFCIAIAFLSHFFLLSSILWMSVMSYDVFVSLLRATGSLRTSSTNFSFKRFGIYCLYSFGIALLFAIASLLADNLDAVPKLLKPNYKGSCWFTNKTALSILFVGPAITLSCINFLFFGLSAFVLHYNKMDQHEKDQKSIHKRRYLMYFRLSVIMGITWIVGVLANIVNATWLWFVFVFLNTLQGFFIFIAFTCCKKVKKYFREKYFGGRRSSELSLTPTFVSYCSYDNPFAKEMDNVAERGKEMTDSTPIPG